MQQPEEPLVFPYEIIWEEIGDSWVTIGDRTIDPDDFASLRKLARLSNPDLPAVDKDALRAIVEPLALPAKAAERLVDDASWIADWYLGPIYRARLRLDLTSQRAVLKQVASAARKLDEVVARLSTPVMSAMYYVRALEPEALAPSGADVADVGQEAHDVAVVADRILKDTAPKRAGPKTKYVRDTTLRLIIEAIDEAGIGPLQISRGNRAKPDRHFLGPAGAFVRAFFGLIAPKTKEHELAQAAEHVRRQSRRSRDVG